MTSPRQRAVNWVSEIDCRVYRKPAFRSRFHSPNLPGGRGFALPGVLDFASPGVGGFASPGVSGFALPARGRAARAVIVS
jgi:hypothetical protein